MKSETTPEHFDGTGVSSRARLVEDLKTLARDANTVIGEISDVTSIRVKNARDAALERARVAKDRTEELVVAHPWRALAVVAGLGALAGWLLRRR